MGESIFQIPTPVYPIDIDTDYTLFHAHESTQTVIAKNVSSTDTFIEIIPVNPEDDEIWPENGFATLSGELIYYDSVERDDAGKVYLLRNCIRDIENTGVIKCTTGTPIYGMVVSQLHNQLVEAILRIQETLGNITEVEKIIEDSREDSTVRFGSAHFNETMNLNATVQSLQACPPAASDDSCPQVDFIFNTFSTTPITAEFCVRVSGEPDFYLLEFGDGNSTQEYQGTHVYASGATIDPVVTVQEGDCTIIMTPETPRPGCEIEPIGDLAVPFHVEIPDVPEFPTFNVPSLACPGPYYDLPPIAVPQIDIAEVCSCISHIFVNQNLAAVIPSFISIIGCCPPSIISITGCCLPSVISHVGCCPPSSISLIGCCLPSKILITGCCPPSEISYIGCCPPSEISYVGCCPPSIISITCCDVPSEISFVGCCELPSAISITCCDLPSIISLIGCCPLPSEITFASCCSVPSEISFTCCDIPSEISIVSCCNIPSEIRFTNCTDLPSEISFIGCCELPSAISITCCDLPSIISLVGCCPLPSEITFVSCCSIPSEITFACCNLPSQISIVSCCDIPSEIAITCCNVPSEISFVGCYDFPSEISITCCSVPSEISFIGCCDLPSFISVTCCDMPSSILLEGCNIPSVISFDCCQIPSEISFVGCNIPSSILLEGCNIPSVISFDCCQIPSEISFVGCDIPNVISFDCCDIPREISFISCCDIPREISFISCCDIPREISIVCCTIPSVTFERPPTISVDWGTPPVVSVAIICNTTSVTPTPLRNQQSYRPYEYDNLSNDNLEINLGELIPSKIELVVPTMPNIKLIHNLPETINLASPDIHLIQDTPIPSVINVIATNIPSTIKLDATDIPSRIFVEAAPNFPSIIHLDTSIRVTGIPSAIEIVGYIPSTIQLIMPEDPVVEMKYSGPPLDFNLKVDLDPKKLIEAGIIQVPPGK